MPVADWASGAETDRGCGALPPDSDGEDAWREWGDRSDRPLTRYERGGGGARGAERSSSAAAAWEALALASSSLLPPVINFHNLPIPFDFFLLLEVPDLSSGWRIESGSMVKRLSAYVGSPGTNSSDGGALRSYGMS